MALPPKGDPQRPLALAVRSTRVLGILFIAIGSLGLLPLFLGTLRGGAPPGGRAVGMTTIVVALSTVLVYLGPGALYLVCSIFLACRRTWAVIAAMVLAGIQLAFILLGVGSLAIMYFSSAAPTRNGFVLIPLAVALLLTLALAQLEYHLSKCFEAIRRAPLDVQRGFEPMAVTPAVLGPTTSDDPRRANVGDPSA